MNRGKFAGLALLAALTLAAPAQAQTVAPQNSLVYQVVHTGIWLAIAGVLFFAAFKIVDWTTPGDLKQQLADGNTALAIYVGSLAIAAAIIIAALVS